MWKAKLYLEKIINIFFPLLCAGCGKQIDSLLFERLTLSKNKNKVMELSRKGQIIERPEDAIKDPYILEFLGLPEKVIIQNPN